MKKMILSIALLLVGVVIGYYTHHFLLLKRLGDFNKVSFDKNNIVEDQELNEYANVIYTSDPISFRAGTRPITPKMADSLMNEYQVQNRNGIFPLKCLKNDGSDDYLKGFFIDRKYLKPIIDDQTNLGLSVYFAKDSVANARHKTNRTYSLVYMGAQKMNTASNTEDNTIKYANPTANGKLYDFIDPCPDACGDFTQQMQIQRISGKPQQ